MRKKLLKILILLLIAIPINIFSINLTDYKPPKAKIINGYIYASFDSDGGNQDQTSFWGRLNGYFDYYYYSNKFTWDTQIKLRMYTGRWSDENSDTSLRLGGSIFTTTDYYLGRGDFFIFGDFNLAYSDDDVLGNSDLDIYEDKDLYQVIVGTGIGYGRFYDVTSMAVAIRVIDELLEFKIIKSKISKAGYIKLAELINNRKEYISKFGDFEHRKYWYADIEKILQNENILVEKNLTALGVIKIEEVTEREAFFMRRYGWTLRSGSHFVIRDYDGEENDPSLFASFKVGIPFSEHLQFTNNVVYDLIFPKEPDISDTLSHQLSNELSLSYELTNSLP